MKPIFVVIAIVLILYTAIDEYNKVLEKHRKDRLIEICYEKTGMLDECKYNLNITNK